MYQTILQKINAVSDANTPLLIAIDGRCASGKTTLSSYLQKELNCNVIHMDYFFLRPEQITEQRLLQPGGNVDYERFYEEVLIPLKNGKAFYYHRYDCHKQIMSETIFVPYCPITIIEGSYSCHPTLQKQDNMKIFLTVEPEEQINRIKKRNGEKAVNAFRQKWIPLEELYFSTYNIKQNCDLYFQT